MTIKEATQLMLYNIESKTTQEAREKGKRSYDKEIAKMLEITPVSYSRLRAGKTAPRIMTWYKITELHKKIIGAKATANIIEQIS